MKRELVVSGVILSLIFFLFLSLSVGAYGLLPAFFPEVENYPAPSWLNEGVRFVHYGLSGSIPHDKYRYFDDETGSFIDRDGNRWRQENYPGTSGQGLIVADVVSLDQGEVVLSLKNYSMMGDSILPGDSTGVRGSAGFINELWVNPDFLSTLREETRAGLRIFRAPFTQEGTIFNAIYFHSETENARNIEIYDVETGILLNKSFTGTGTGSGVTWHGTSPHVSHFQQFQLLGFRQLDLPWSQGLLSPASLNTKILQYDGYFAYTTLPSARAGRQLFYQTKSSSPRWLSLKQITVTQGYEAFPVEKNVVSGIAQIGGAFIPPLALTVLTEGQLIDYDPVTGVQVTVIFNGTSTEGYRLLGIQEAGRDFSADYYYNQDGILVGIQNLSKPFRWAGDETQQYFEYWLTYHE